MQELRAQIQAQLKLADTLKKISEAAGEKFYPQFPPWLAHRGLKKNIRIVEKYF